jgi:hypothetical protein
VDASQHSDNWWHAALSLENTEENSNQLQLTKRQYLQNATVQLQLTKRQSLQIVMIQSQPSLHE